MRKHITNYKCGKTCNQLQALEKVQPVTNAIKRFFFNLEKAYKGQISICNQMQTLGNLWLVSAGNDEQHQ